MGSNPTTAPNIPGYRIFGKLGEGGMGIVYKANQLSMNRSVAIKVLHARQTRSEEGVERFRREIQILAQLSHPNIVVAFDTGQVGESMYYVMEYVQGVSPLKLLERGPLPESKAIDVGLQVARALAHAHKHKLVHRDIKPENIIVTDDDVVKLLDLGIARSLEEHGGSTITAEGMMVGTPAYISPEQALGERADIRSDIYSLGVTLYQLATGDVPFHADTTANLIRAHITRPVPPPHARNTALSPGFSRLVLKMLEKEPKNRFQSPQDLIAALEGLQLQHATRQGVPQKKPSRIPVAPARESPWKNATKGAIVLAVLAALIVILKSAMSSTPPEPPPKKAPPPPLVAEKVPEKIPEKPPVKPRVKDMRTEILDTWQRLAPAIKSRSQDVETQDILSSWTQVLRAAHEEDPALAKEFLQKSTDELQTALDAVAVQEIKSLGADTSRWSSARARATELHRATAYVRWVQQRARQIVPQEEKTLDECAAILGRVLGFKGTFRLRINVFPHDSKLWTLSKGDQAMVKDGAPKGSLKAEDLWMPVGLVDLEIGDWTIQVKQDGTTRELRLDSSKIKAGGRVWVYGSMKEASLQAKYE